MPPGGSPLEYYHLFMNIKKRHYLNRITLKILVLICFYNLLYGNNIQTIGSQIFLSNTMYHQQIQHMYCDIYSPGAYSLLKWQTGNVEFVNSMYITNDSLAARKGGAKRVKGVFGYTNLAYMQVTHSSGDYYYKFNLGRDYILMGYGYLNNLVISRSSRPFDQANITMGYKDINLSFYAIQLDNFGSIRRYLTISAIDLLIGDNLSLLMGQAMLFSGERRNWELQFINPILFWMPELANGGSGDGNGFLFLSLRHIINEYFSVWNEILIDDWQYNNQRKGDLEPNETGLILGMEYKDDNQRVGIEYTQVANRTYQTPEPAETYTHRGLPIGHYLGNDFDMIQLHYEQKLNRNHIQPYIDLAYLRDGDNGLDTPWDEPWMDSTITMETGYSEPFPTRPINYIFELELGVEYKFWQDSFITTGFFWQRKENSGIVTTDYGITLRLWLSLNKEFNY